MGAVVSQKALFNFTILLFFVMSTQLKSNSKLGEIIKYVGTTAFIDQFDLAIVNFGKENACFIYVCFALVSWFSIETQGQLCQLK